MKKEIQIKGLKKTSKKLYIMMKNPSAKKNNKLL
jgi:predicted GIY-YIG superfamily endonuclease